MKRILIICLLLLPAVSAKSQVLISLLLGDKLNSDKLEFGLDGGLNITDIKGLPQKSSDSRFFLGFYFDFKLKDPSWMIHTGVIVKSTMGAKEIPVYELDDPDLNAAFVGGSVERRLSYFNVPFLMKYRFKNNFSVESGIMLGLMNKSLDVFSREVIDKEDLTYKIKIRDNYHPLDAGLMAGVNYQLMRGNGMNLGIRYYYGLVDITINDTTPNEYNRSLYFSVGIPIGKGKKASGEVKD